jgi:hypothetical protein
MDWALILLKQLIPLLKKILGDPDRLLDFVVSWLPNLQLAAQKTGTLLDDMALRSAEVTLNDPKFREQFAVWWGGWLTDARVLSAMSPDELREWVEADATLQKLAGRLNIDWKALIELVLKYLPLILPLVLGPKDEGGDEKRIHPLT